MLHIQQWQGDINDLNFDSQARDQARQFDPNDGNPFNWYYEFNFTRHSRETDKIIPFSEKRIRITPTKMAEILKLFEYVLPVIHGWHVLHNVENVGNFRRAR